VEAFFGNIVIDPSAVEVVDGGGSVMCGARIVVDFVVGIDDGDVDAVVS
jgi:hypothetical protein